MSTDQQQPDTEFLPPDYEPPQSGGHYLRPSKLPVGESRIRILAPPTLGSQGWATVNGKDKPISAPMGQEISGEGVRDVKHMWWMPVWDYRTRAVMLAEVTQNTIQTKIGNFAKNADWGSPLHYDLAITKKGSGIDTEYDVIPIPKKPLPADALEAWRAVLAAGFDISRVFRGEDPFEAKANGGGFADPAANDPASARRRYFAKLNDLIRLGIYGKSLVADNEDGKFERRKLLKALLGGDPDPTTMSAELWNMAIDRLIEIEKKNTPDDLPRD